MSTANLFSQSSKLVGYVIQMDYQCAKILTHDHSISEANYLPQGSFILIKVESASSEAAILCRVNKINYNNSDAIQNKISSIQRLSSPENPLAQQKGANDVFTQNHISYFELDCKILGTFYEKGGELCYGSDAYSFFVSHIYSVYKPNGESLEFISNFVKKDKIEATKELLDKLSVKNKVPAKILDFPIGTVRYASTLLEHNEDAEVRIFPSDFIKQKTGIFGMTRTGKSNTVKTIAKSIMDLSKNLNIPIGQLIYDINGEYANNNDQNNRLTENNLYTVDVNSISSGFNPSLNNFYLSPNYGLNIIQEGIKAEEKGANYLNVFLSIKNLEENPILFLLWMCLLYKSAFNFPNVINTSNYKEINGMIPILVQKDLIFFDIKEQEFHINFTAYPTLHNVLNSYFTHKLKAGVYEINENSINNFVKSYMKHEFKKDGDKWTAKEHPLYQIIRNMSIDNELHYFSLLGFILQEDRTSGGKLYTSGWQMVVPYQYCHCQFAHKDYRDIIYKNLVGGETVIIDFSIGDPFTRKYIADELMEYIFERQVEVFRKSISCPIINVFIEEAHNVIGQKAAIDSLWPRVAKEGAKYNIGVLYATQEPSAIHHNILANTANFIVAHLNNDVEIKSISQFADLADFAYSIKNCEDVGFVRMKLLSKPYTIPVQVRKYDGTS